MYCFRFISALSVTIARFRVFYCTQYCFFFLICQANKYFSNKNTLTQIVVFLFFVYEQM